MHSVDPFTLALSQSAHQAIGQFSSDVRHVPKHELCGPWWACGLLQSRTAPPPRLSEAALISLMERHGIGTDATVAEHINKQLERGCACQPSLPRGRGYKGIPPAHGALCMQASAKSV